MLASGRPPMSSNDAVSRSPSLCRAWLLLPVVLAIAVFFWLDGPRYATPEALAEHREMLLAAVARHGTLAYFAFVAAYTVLVAVSIPGAAFLTIVGGFLFGTWVG